MKPLLTPVTMVLVLTACDLELPAEVAREDASPAPHLSAGGAPLRVMTRNVYVGTNVDRVLAAASAEEIPIRTAEAFQTLLATDFRARAGALAAEVSRERPDLIGLQEVSTILLQSPGDAVVGGTQPAEVVLFDYLEILLEALEAYGLHYRVVGSVQNADVEVPMVTGFAPPTFDDVRLVDFDVVLAARDVTVSDVVARNFVARLVVPFGDGLAIEVPRGFVALTASVGGRTYRFANTHLEPGANPEVLPIQLAQADELLGALVGETLPVVLVGDLNSHAPFGETYEMLLAAGYVDAWIERAGLPQSAGFTCCHDDDLRNPTAAFDRRIDLVMVRQAAGTDAGPFAAPPVVSITGVRPDERTMSGLWPSDHGGVAAEMLIPTPELFVR